MFENTITFFANFYNTLPAVTIETLPFYIVNICIYIVVLKVLGMIYRLLLNKHLGWKSKPFISPEGHTKRILILGDSTAVGTGASKQEDTLAGRFAHDFPKSEVINLGTNGGRIRDLKKQIEKVRGQRFDMIIISAGGNDVWHFTSIRTIKKHLEEVLKEAIQMSDHKVIYLVYNNIGSAPIFPSLIQVILGWRCKRVHEEIRTIAHRQQVPTIELFSKTTDNPFLKNPEVLFARDGIHPSSRGYELWYHRMWLEMTKNGYHYE